MDGVAGSRAKVPVVTLADSHAFHQTVEIYLADTLRLGRPRLHLTSIEVARPRRCLTVKNGIACFAVDTVSLHIADRKFISYGGRTVRHERIKIKPVTVGGRKDDAIRSFRPFEAFHRRREAAQEWLHVALCRVVEIETVVEKTRRLTFCDFTANSAEAGGRTFHHQVAAIRRIYGVGDKSSIGQQRVDSQRPGVDLDERRAVERTARQVLTAERYEQPATVRRDIVQPGTARPESQPLHEPRGDIETIECRPVAPSRHAVVRFVDALQRAGVFRPLLGKAEHKIAFIRRDGKASVGHTSSHDGFPARDRIERHELASFGRSPREAEHVATGHPTQARGFVALPQVAPGACFCHRCAVNVAPVRLGLIITGDQVFPRRRQAHAAIVRTIEHLCHRVHPLAVRQRTQAAEIVANPLHT